MANLSIRKVDNRVYQALQHRAFDHGVSMEEEIRQILYQAVHIPEDISQVFKQYFEEPGIMLNLQDHQNPHDPIEL